MKLATVRSSISYPLVSLTVKLDLLLLGLHEDDDVASEVHHGAAPMMEIEGVFGSPLTANQITLSDWRDSPHNVRSQYVLESLMRSCPFPSLSKNWRRLALRSRGLLGC